MNRLSQVLDFAELDGLFEKNVSVMVRMPPARKTKVTELEHWLTESHGAVAVCANLDRFRAHCRLAGPLVSDSTPCAKPSRSCSTAAVWFPEMPLSSSGTLSRSISVPTCPMPEPQVSQWRGRPSGREPVPLEDSRSL